MTAFSQPPETPPGVYPYLTVTGGKAAVAFYQKAFGAQERFRNTGPDSGLIMHSQLVINGSIIMLSDDFSGSAPPAARVTLHLQVDDAKTWWDRAVAAGATVIMPLEDQFWGDRYGQLKDPYGHSWSIGQKL
ncbi:MAG TPA: glyoxalase/bleomycin resistance/extradiol dioxygenase family protein [Caulobacter sp.]|nr:glyoxalase/bleomycin resistance/extradiol dioxygenase family protein [Caulobacter sp.]